MTASLTTIAISTIYVSSPELQQRAIYRRVLNRRSFSHAKPMKISAPLFIIIFLHACALKLLLFFLKLIQFVINFSLCNPLHFVCHFLYSSDKTLERRTVFMKQMPSELRRSLN